MAKRSKINGARVLEFRKRQGMSQKELAKVVGSDPRTVSRWENGNIARLRTDKLGKLCNALNVHEQDLCATGPVPPEATRRVAEKGQMNVSVRDAHRNALVLVGLRYGVTRQQIISVAPLLFFIFAEKSLRDRQARLDEFEAKADALVDATPPHLPTKSPTHDNALAAERESIDARDVFASNNKIWKDVDSQFHPSWSDDRNPLVECVRDALRAVSDNAKVEYWMPRVGVGYEVCREQAVDIVGGDEVAAKAILSGAAPLHELPPKVRATGAAADRVAEWARECQARFDEDMRSLDAILDRREGVGSIDQGAGPDRPS